MSLHPGRSLRLAAHENIRSVPAYSYTVAEHDPNRPWIVVGEIRRCSGVAEPAVRGHARPLVAIARSLGVVRRLRLEDVDWDSSLVPIYSELDSVGSELPRFDHNGGRYDDFSKVARHKLQ